MAGTEVGAWGIASRTPVLGVSSGLADGLDVEEGGAHREGKEDSIFLAWQCYQPRWGEARGGVGATRSSTDSPRRSRVSS